MDGRVKPGHDGEGDARAPCTRHRPVLVGPHGATNTTVMAGLDPAIHAVTEQPQRGHQFVPRPTDGAPK